MANEEAGDERGHSGSTAVRAAAAAAVAGAASYGVRKALEHRGDGHSGDEEPEGDGGGGLTAKDDLSETLSTKAADVRKAAGKLVPRRQSNDLSSLASSAWEAALEQLMPFAGQAAAALGRTVAEKAPEQVQKEIIPRFIEGLQRAD